MMPTYHVLMGIPGRSYAIHVARHLGMPGHMLAEAEAMMDPSRAEAESILEQLHQEREETSRIREKAEKAKIQAETTRKDLQNKLSNVTRLQENMIEKSRVELRRETEEIRRSLRKIVSKVRDDKDLATAQRAIGRIRNQFSDPTWLPLTPPPENEISTDPDLNRPLQSGDQVEIKGLDVQAVVIEVNPDGIVELQMGNARIELNERQLRLMKAPNVPNSSKEAARITVNTTKSEKPVQELDVRGSRVDESEQLVTEFIDNASMQGLTSIRIIHGTGTGALREAIRSLLANHSLVGSFSAAPKNQGGNGATLVDLS